MTLSGGRPASPTRAPGGDPTPSSADIEMTRRIVDAGQKLQIAVHDHIIVGRKGHASFRALGLI